MKIFIAVVCAILVAYGIIDTSSYVLKRLEQWDARKKDAWSELKAARANTDAMIWHDNWGGGPSNPGWLDTGPYNLVVIAAADYVDVVFKNKPLWIPLTKNERRQKEEALKVGESARQSIHDAAHKWDEKKPTVKRFAPEATV